MQEPNNRSHPTAYCLEVEMQHTLCDILRRNNCDTGWRRPIGCLKLQVIFHHRAIDYGALLRKMTYEDKASYGSSPPCSVLYRGRYAMIDASGTATHAATHADQNALHCALQHALRHTSQQPLQPTRQHLLQHALQHIVSRVRDM